MNNEGHFTWRTNYLPRCIYLCTWEIFMKLRTIHSLCMCYNWFKFGCNWSIMKGTLLKEQNTFSGLSRLKLDRSLWKSIPITLCACNLSCLLFKWSYSTCTPIKHYTRVTNCKFDCDRSITNNSLLKKPCTFSALSHLLFEGSIPNSTPITHCACTTICICLVAIGQ